MFTITASVSVNAIRRECMKGTCLAVAMSLKDIQDRLNLLNGVNACTCTAEL